MQPVIPPEGHEPAVVFDMPEDAYHADPALGSTDIRRLLQGPSEFHYSWGGNPDSEDGEETDALTFGRAVHKLVLEGTQAFEGRYAQKPEGPDVLVTLKDLQAWCRAHGMLEKGTKETLSERILQINPHVKIQDVLVARAVADGKTMLSDDAYRRIRTASAYITKNPNLSRSFEGGHREVSVFWIDPVRRIRCKARFDYLKVIPWQDRRTAMIVDLKSFGRLKPNQPIIQAINEAAAGYKHQAAHYLEGLKQARKLISDGLVHGEHEVTWLNRVATSQAALFAFVFFKSTGAPYAQAKLLSPENPILEIARRDIETALHTFRSYYEAFGSGGPWVAIEEPQELSIDELPRWLL